MAVVPPSNGDIAANADRYGLYDRWLLRGSRRRAEIKPVILFEEPVDPSLPVAATGRRVPGTLGR